MRDDKVGVGGIPQFRPGVDDPSAKATCGHCSRSWNYVMNPTPASRCPFEYDHDESPGYIPMIPEAVVVDKTDGYTYWRTSDGKLMTGLTARLFAQARNGERKSEYQTLQAFWLHPIGS